MDVAQPRPASPASPGKYASAHSKQPSTASIAIMQRAKRSSSRITDGMASRSSDEESSRTAVKVGMYISIHPPPPDM